MDICKYFIMGLPEAGKTTFLAALWYILNNSEKSNLKVDSYTGNHMYLADIGKKWANAEKMPRTLISTEKMRIEIQLKTKENKKVVLAVPDLSGESFQEQYINRVAHSDHVKCATDCSRLLLFIHPEKIIRPLSIAEIPVELRTNEPNCEIIKPRSPKEDPTQVQLVELLQFMLYLTKKQPHSLSIVISAWDLVEAHNPKWNPEDLVKNELPLLWQYVTSNLEAFETVFYGISALGGNPDEADKLIEIADPCDRVLFVDQDGTKSSDITLLLTNNFSKK